MYKYFCNGKQKRTLFLERSKQAANNGACTIVMEWGVPQNWFCCRIVKLGVKTTKKMDSEYIRICMDVLMPNHFYN